MKQALPLATDRIAIIGAGHVGATTAYALMLRALSREIVLIDTDEALARSEAEDISDANALARPARIFAGNFADCASARIVVLTAGAATHGKESRLDVATRSAQIVRSCVSQLASAGFSGVLVVSANPVDLMALAAWRASGLAASQVIGTGTLLDSMRMRQEIAALLRVAPGSVTGMVLGEHGDSEVSVLSSVRIGGLPIDRYSATGAGLDGEKLAASVRAAAYRIISGKGYTSFGVATAAVRICEAILRAENTILPVSTLLTGQFGLSDIYLSLPCVLGAGGVERVLLPDLTAAEEAALRHSGAVLQQASGALTTK
ncbi:MAG: L-lactate dehydrogenase [Croceibacterium sp.]